MSAVEARAVAEQQPNKMLKKQVKNSTLGPRSSRAALGEITNCQTTANYKKTGRAKAAAKASSPQKVKPPPPLQEAPPLIQEAPPLIHEPPPLIQEPPPLIPAPAAPTVPKESGDVTMTEGEEHQLCRAFSETLLAVQDVDEEDGEQPQLCSQYVKEIYKYLHVLEEQQPIRENYMQGYDITARMRALLIDWLVQVHSRFQLLQETLYLTVAVLDRFLQVQPVSRRKLQLVGVTAMLVASKYEEMYAPEVGDFAYITDDAFTRSQILEMEQLVLRSLHFQLGRPLPLHFLRRASKVAKSDVERHTLAKYLMELTLIDYHMVHYRPSEVAAAALCLSQLLLDARPWSPTQQHYSSYDQTHLHPIMQHIAKNVVMVNEGRTKFQAIRTKYSSRRLLSISLLPQLQSLVLLNLASALLKP